MIFTHNNRQIDTERDLTEAERHIVQKLLAWKSVAGSLEAFREKTRQAFAAGWNGSGPIRERDQMRLITALLEEGFRPCESADRNIVTRAARRNDRRAS